MSLQVLKQKTKNNNPYVPITSYINPHPVGIIINNGTVNYSTNSFSIVGPYRSDRRGVGYDYKMSKNGTPFKGLYPYNFNNGPEAQPVLNAGPGIIVQASQAYYTKKGNISPANRMKQLQNGCSVTKTTGALNSSNYLWLKSNAANTKQTNAMGFVKPSYPGCACLQLNGINTTGIPFNGQHIY
jgi:hypothetical protein